MTRAVAISLKIPDNEAYTALVALRRLGVSVDRVERSQIYLFDDASADDALKRRIVRDETIFNPNKHRLALLEQAGPREGEVWIEPLSYPERSERSERAAAISWRLFNAEGTPVERAVVAMAAERLLCNPAIDRAVTSDPQDGDISTVYE
jgi:phosphoribosylformylglycinamidine (FGAM) synthase PurS component